MDTHKNARLTFRSRKDLVVAIAGGTYCRHAAAVFRVTAKTADFAILIWPSFARLIWPTP